MTYKIEEKLELPEKVYLTKEAYELLREQKKLTKMSLAKIASNLIIEKYGMSRMQKTNGESN